MRNIPTVVSFHGSSGIQVQTVTVGAVFREIWLWIGRLCSVFRRMAGCGVIVGFTCKEGLSGRVCSGTRTCKSRCTHSVSGKDRPTCTESL